jgi:acid stress-induced BolA-like protein IbaG/YrbA
VVSTDEIKQRIEAALPECRAEVTGDGHHFRAEVVSPAFAGLTRIQQHQLVNTVFGSELGGRIHALSLKTTTE